MDCRWLVERAIREDLDGQADWTTVAMIPENGSAKAAVVSRAAGVFVGEHLVPLIAAALKTQIDVEVLVRDGMQIDPKQSVLVLSGNARGLLTLERTFLNFAGRLSGVASLTHEFVKRVAGTNAEICDTRKTTPGWRRLEKYAVHCGGGVNHRMGLYDAILIKDNHLAFAHDYQSDWGRVMSDAIRSARRVAADVARQSTVNRAMIVEVEVDTLEQFRFVLDESPDIILLDNMSCAELTSAVRIRDEVQPQVSLEASGGVNLGTVRAIAETGVDRISVGGLTHSAINFDLGLDWLAR
jgi:nicotinate-nucleotide pyrophosphorylase (carboxylating)